MDRQIRRLGIAFVGCSRCCSRRSRYVQVFAADRIAERTGERATADPAPSTRWSAARSSRATPDGARASQRRERRPSSPTSSCGSTRDGELYGQLTGYYSRIYGRSGLEQAMNPYLSGNAPEFAAQNLTDLVLGRPKQGGDRRHDDRAASCRRRRARRSGDRPGRGRRDRPGDRRRPRDGTRTRATTRTRCRPAPTRDQRRLEQADRRPRAAAALASAIHELYLPGSTFKLDHGVAPRWRTAADAETDVAEPARARPAAVDQHAAELRQRALRRRRDDGHDGAGVQQSCNVTFGRDRAAARRRQAPGAGAGVRVLPDRSAEADRLHRADDPVHPPVPDGRFPVPAYFDAERAAAGALARSGWTTCSANPLQMALVAAAIANGGTMMQPRLVTEIRDPHGPVVRRRSTPQEYGRPISPHRRRAARR